MLVLTHLSCSSGDAGAEHDGGSAKDTESPEGNGEVAAANPEDSPTTASNTAAAESYCCVLSELCDSCDGHGQFSDCTPFQTAIDSDDDDECEAIFRDPDNILGCRPAIDVSWIDATVVGPGCGFTTVDLFRKLPTRGSR